MAKGFVNVPAPDQTDEFAAINHVHSADEVTFADGNTMQQKLDSGDLKGAPGDPGADGTSAYEAAKAAGYTGTEEEFNALLFIIGAHAGRHESGGADPLDLSKLAGILPAAKGGTGVESLAALATAMGGAKIATGSYTGTGTYGASNPCSLTFDFVPRALLIFKYATPTYNPLGQFSDNRFLSDPIAFWSEHQFNQTTTYNSGFAWTLSGHTLSWWVTDNGGSATLQMNESGYTFLYLAIG